MSQARLSVAVMCLGGLIMASGGPADPVIIPSPPSAEAIAVASSFGTEERVVATHYFYWYRWPDEHFFGDAQRTVGILRHHFPDDRVVSYESAGWHRKQMEDMRAAGIDVALCVYWGTPNQYEKPDVRFSVHGLPPLVTALDELAKAGAAPRIGLFYDTSTLLGGHAFREPGRGNVDLRTPEGKDIFYRTIRDFFCLIPPRHWACLDGRPLVQLYESAFAAGHDQGVIDYVHEHFAADFAGRRPMIVAGPSWSLKTDLRTGWGAALGGPILGDGAVQIGPGYDDSPVPGRTTPTRDRLGGGFYAASWLLALQARPRLIILETWSEMHEGTDICETLEDGRRYIDLTRHFSEILKARGTPAQEDWAGAVRTLLSAAASSREGREFASRITVRFDAGATGTHAEQGLRLCRGVADGVYEVTEIAEARCVRTKPGVGASQYLYFDIADPYYYDHRGTLRLRFTYFDVGREPILVEYDSAQETGGVRDRYLPAAPPILRTDSATWKTAAASLPNARCANRQNGGADFRFVSVHGEMAIGRIDLSKLADDYNQP